VSTCTPPDAHGTANAAVASLVVTALLSAAVLVPTFTNAQLARAARARRARPLLYIYFHPAFVPLAKSSPAG
jgi:hypothetical protein